MLAILFVWCSPASGRVGDFYVTSGLPSELGGLIRVDHGTGVRTMVSANDAPVGGPTFVWPEYVAVEADGSVLVVDDKGGLAEEELIRIDPVTGTRTLVSSNLAPPGPHDFLGLEGIAVEASGDIVVANSDDRILRVDPQTGERTIITRNGSGYTGPELDAPSDVAVETGGTVLVANDSSGGVGEEEKILRVDPVTGARTRVSKNSSPSGAPQFNSFTGLALGPNGQIRVADQGAFGNEDGRVIRVHPTTGVRSTISENAAPAGAPSFYAPAELVSESRDYIAVVDRYAFNDFAGGLIRVDRRSGARTRISSNQSPAGAPEFVNPRGIEIEGPQLVPIQDPDPFGPAPGGPVEVPVDPGDDDPPPPPRGGGNDKRVAPAAVRRSTRFTYDLSARATVLVRVDRRSRGRVDGGHCRPETARNRKRPRCIRHTLVGAFTQAGARGRNRKSFAGRIGKRVLRAGSYRAVLRAFTADGYRSVPVDVVFKVVRG